MSINDPSISDLAFALGNRASRMENRLRDLEAHLRILAHAVGLPADAEPSEVVLVVRDRLRNSEAYASKSEGA